VVVSRRAGGAQGRSAHEAEGTSSDPAARDRALLARARREPEAFGEFFDRHWAAVVRWHLAHTGSAHTAMELAAETFAQALAGVHRYDPAQGSGAAWLYGIAAHQYHRYLRSGEVDRRHRTRLWVSTPVVTPDDAERIVELVDAARWSPRLDAALGELTDGVRAAVELRVGQDLPYAEVAARLGCTELGARLRVRRGLRKLAVVLVAR
jgi:RNA polymerase sigma factor (sigma-70 family)